MIRFSVSGVEPESFLLYGTKNYVSQLLTQVFTISAGEEYIWKWSNYFFIGMNRLNVVKVTIDTWQ